jgi:hypothetical protein
MFHEEGADVPVARTTPVRDKCLRCAGNVSSSSAQDNHPHPFYARYVCLVRFSFLILIGRFVTLEP